MYLWPQKDGSVTYTGSFNQEEWDAYMAAHPKAKVPPAAEPESEVDPDEDEYDPAAYTVAEVNAYLEDADEDEFQRVLAAEAAGKARVGITGAQPDEED